MSTIVTAPGRFVRLALNRTEASAAIGVSPTTFDEMVLAGHIPPARHFNRCLFWMISELEDCIAALPVRNKSKNQPSGEWAAR